MFKLKCDDFLIRDEETGNYYMSAEQQVRDETEKNRWKTTGLTLLKDWRLYLMLVPMILVYVLWKYLPMYELTAAFRFGNRTEIADRPWVGIEAFRHIFASTTAINEPGSALSFWRAFRNTLIIAFYGLLFGFPTPIILALFFNEVKSNIARSIMQVCVYLPKFISTVIVTSLTITLFRGTTGGTGLGVISQLLDKISTSSTLHARLSGGLIYSSEYFRPIYIITDIWEHAGYDSIVFFAAVIAVSPTSYEAAQIDGAGKMAQMRYVVIPSILSTVVIMLIMKIGGLLSVSYEKIYLLAPSTGLANYEVADVVSTWANQMSGNMQAQAYGIAGEMTNNLIGMILVIGANTISRKVSDVSLY